MPTTETLSSRRRTEVLALMCAALAVVTAAFISLNVALGSLLNLGYRGTIDDRLADEQVREAARPSVQAAAQTAQGLGDRSEGVLDVAQAAFVDGLHIAFYSGAGAVLLGTLLFLRLAPWRAPRRATATTEPIEGIT